MRPFLSLALLGYNEKDTLEKAAHRCAQVLDASLSSYELVLVDDGSTDGSQEILPRLAEQLPCCQVIQHPRNLGIGAGIRTCYFGTRGEWATWFPADLQADPRALPHLLEQLNACDVLVTYRPSACRQVGWPRKVISLTDRTLTRLLFGVALNDLHWIRFFRRSLLDSMRLTSRSPFVDTEMMVCARKLGARIRQTPLPDHPREHGVSRGASWKNLVTSVTDLVALRLRGVRLVGDGHVGTPPTHEE